MVTVKLHKSLVVRISALVGASFDTGPATHTGRAVVHQTGTLIHIFGILAPLAPQGAALHKYHGSDARPVVHRETLDVGHHNSLGPVAALLMF